MITCHSGDDAKKIIEHFFSKNVQELLKEKTLTKKQIRSIRDSVMIRA